MLTKKDIRLIFLLTVAAGALLLALRFWRAEEHAHSAFYVRYSVNGETMETIPLKEEREIVVDQGNGTSNTLRLWLGGIAMVSSTCRNQLCVYQGEVTPNNMDERPLYHMIVCAPHRLVVELVSAEEVDAANAEQ